MRRLRQKLIDFYYFWRNGVPNLIRWLPLIWHDVDFDYEPVLDILEYKFSRMADVQEHYGHGVHSLKYAKQLRTCVALIKRIKDDSEHSYMTNVGWDYENGFVNWNRLSPQEQQRRVKHSRYMEQHDLKYLGEIIGKYLTRWWD